MELEGCQLDGLVSRAVMGEHVGVRVGGAENEYSMVWSLGCIYVVVTCPLHMHVLFSNTNKWCSKGRLVDVRPR